MLVGPDWMDGGEKSWLMAVKNGAREGCDGGSRKIQELFLALSQLATCHINL